MNNGNNQFLSVLEEIPTRCVIIMDEKLDTGHMANAIAVIALTAGQRHPVLVGAPLIDGSDYLHPGLIPIGIPMLHCPAEQLNDIRQAALDKGCDVVDFPVEGQQTKNYDEFIVMMSTIPMEQIRYLGLALIGNKKVINKLTGNLAMIKRTD